jgi:uncharacterized protein (TIGR02265 family)
MQKVKGTVLKSRMAFVLDLAGAAGLEAVLASVGAEHRAALEKVGIVGWYPFELGKALDDAIVTVAGKGDPKFFLQLGRASADKNLAVLHKTFIAHGDPQAFLAKAPEIYARYYETGRREYRATGERSGVITTLDAETFSAPDCLTVIGWYERALELCGAKHPSVVEEECRATGGATCRYRVSWE